LLYRQGVGTSFGTQSNCAAQIIERHAASAPVFPSARNKNIENASKMPAIGATSRLRRKSAL
jgi:hypothetical protein